MDADHRRPSLGLLAGALLVLAAALPAMGPLSDNSFLTHLATGRLILERGAVPSADPYTFTAGGEPWVVQSWLMSVVYASAESVGGLNGVRVVVAALVAGVAALGWRLLRPVDGLVARLGLGVLFLIVGSAAWSERPLTFGLVAFALVVLTVEDELDPRWLVPLGWLWANSHGSFPLGLVYLGVVAIGSRMDGRSPTVELRALLMLSVGVVSGILGPLGLRALMFPLDLLGHQEVLGTVIEWQAPRFTDLWQRAFLLQVMLAVVLLVRRPTYRSAAVLAVFTAASLIAARNIGVASIALLPSMAAAASPQLGSISSSQRLRRPVGSIAVVLVVAVGAVAGVVRLSGSPTRFDRYPVDALGYLESAGVDTASTRLAGPEILGNFLTYVYGADGRVFYDDRFDMFPQEVSEAHLAIAKGSASLRAELDEHEIDLVLVQRSSPTSAVLVAAPDWRTLFADEHWSLSCRRGQHLAEDLRC